MNVLHFTFRSKLTAVFDLLVHTKINVFPCCAWYVGIPPQFQLANLHPKLCGTEVIVQQRVHDAPKWSYKSRDKPAEPDTIENNAQTRLKVR